jgi:Leucine-rich repeat (LRR) protein
LSLRQVNFVFGQDLIFINKAISMSKTLEDVQMNCLLYQAPPLEDPTKVLLQEAFNLHTLQIDLVEQWPQDNLPLYQSKCTKLRSLHIHRMRVDIPSLCEDIWPTLRYLDLSHNALDDQSILILSKMIKNPTCCLHRLSLDGNLITHVNIGVLTEAISSSKTMRTLDMSDNFLGNRGFTTLLACTPSLHTLRARKNTISMRLHELCLALASSSLALLYIEGNHVMKESLDVGCVRHFTSCRVFMD